MSGTLKIGGKTLATHDTSSNQINLHSDILATTTQVQGVHTTATTTKATNANELTSVTAVSGYNLADVSVGDYVTGEGILVGTTVSTINGTTITLTHPDGNALSSSMTDLASDPVVFYNATKALSAGTVAGGLCRAWVNFDGVNQTIRASFNVSSISYATGDYTVNFATAMPDANYVFTEGRNASGTGGTSVCTYSDATRLATSLRLLAVTGSNSVADSSTCLIAIFR